MSLNTNRKKTFFGLAVGLIVVGGYFLFFVGIPLIMDSGKPQELLSPLEQEKCGERYRCATTNYSYQYLLPNGEEGVFSVQINHTTDKVFSVFNRINYSAVATISKPDSIKNIHLVFLTSYQNYTINENPKNIIEKAMKEERIITMIKQSSTKFDRIGFWKIPFETPFSFFVVLEITDNFYGAYPETLPIFMIESHLGKLQADTNIAILDQIRESESSNMLIEGLTWIGVSIIPLLLGGEILLRLFLDPYLERK